MTPAIPDLRSLVDIPSLQRLQDEVSRNVGTAVSTLDSRQGRCTEDSNCSALCKLIQGSQKGRTRCESSEAKGAKRAQGAVSSGKEASAYLCHAGLAHFAVPIVVDGQAVGTLLGGQVFLHPPEVSTIERFRNLARSLRLPQKAEAFAEAAGQIPVWSQEKIRSAAHLVRLTANTISHIASQRWQTDRLSEVREGLMEGGGLPSLEDVLAGAVHDLRVAVGAAQAALVLKDAGGGFALRAAFRPNSGKGLAGSQAPWESLTALVAATGLPVRVRDIHDARELAMNREGSGRPGKLKEGVPVQVLAVAVKSEAHLVRGVLLFAGKVSGNQFTEEDEWLAAAYAQKIARAMALAEGSAESCIDEEHAYERRLQEPAG